MIMSMLIMVINIDDDGDQDEDEMMLRRLPRHPRGASQGALSICIARTRQ